MAGGLDMSAFRGQFREEAVQLIQTVTQGLLLLEQEPNDAETLKEVARAMHTLKGSARLMGLEKLNQLAHRMEEMLIAVRDGQLAFTPAAADVILKALDLVTAATENFCQTGEEGIEVAGMCAEMDRVAAGGDAQPPAGALPAAPSQTQNSAGPAGTAPPVGPPAEDQPSKTKPPQHRPKTAAAAKPQGTPAGPGQPQQPAGKPHPTRSAESIRVDTRKLDSLANLAGEMVVNLLKFQAILDSVREIVGRTRQHVRAWGQLRDELVCPAGSSEPVPPADRRRGRMHELVQRCEQTTAAVQMKVEGLSRRLSDDIMRVDATTRRLEEDVMSIRMQPVSILFNTFPRAVRDLSRSLGKPVKLELAGGDTELDRRILDTIRDPLLHLVRNALSHGIESAEQRQRAGKPPEGRLRLAAWQQGDQVFVQVCDDGRGIDPERVREAAVAKGLVEPAVAETLGRDQCLRLVFEPGFSTSRTVSDLSGRGVGMDVVKACVEEMHGEVRVDSEVGSGTAVTLALPLTLAISRALLVKCDDRTLAVPIGSVEMTTRLTADQIKSVEGKEAIIVRGQAVPLLWLSHVLRPGPPRPTADGQNYHAMVIAHSQLRFAFVVDELVGEQEMVVKPLAAPLKRVKNVAGAAILGSGEVVLVLHVPDLVAAARGRLVRRAATGSQPRQSKRPKRVLVVEDSLAARELEKTLFETAGFEVVTAVDGLDALQKLGKEPVQLVVTDIQMPRMDGFELTNRLKTDERYRHLPIIIVTTRDSAEDRQRGLAVGADAYFVKSSVHSEDLIECSRRLIE